MVVDVIRTRAFEFADIIRDQEIWRSTQANMYVRFDASDRVKPNFRRFEDLVGQIVIKAVFDPFTYHRQTRFGMPGIVEIDLGVNTDRHTY